MKIDTAALISPTAADSYYPTRTVNAQTYLTATPPEIVELARALKYNPDLIYEYVRNNIDVAWTYGLQKGALGTLIDRSGTSFDQATLMIALLNQSNFTASYVSGTITLNSSQFAAWTGISDANAACQMLANGGIPAVINGQTNMVCGTGPGGGINTVQLAHIWVKVNIPNSSCAANCLFDPSYKPYTKITTGFNLPSATGLVSGHPFDVVTGGMSSGTIAGTGVQYVKGLDSVDLNSALSGYSQALLNCIQTDCQQIGTTAPHLEDIVGGGVIVAYVSPAGGLRQTTLPYTSSTSHTWTCTPPVTPICNVPNTYRTTLRVQGWMWDYDWTDGHMPPPPGEYDLMFDITFFADEIYGRSLIADTDYGNLDPNFYDPHNKYANSVDLRLDGVSLASYVDPGIFEGYTPQGVPLLATSRGAPSYFTLTADHPYAASNNHTATTNGNYMDAAITKSVVLITPLAIVDGWGDTSGRLFNKLADERVGDKGMPYLGTHCPGEDPPGLCVNMYPGGQGDFEREKVGALWLAQYSRAARLNGAIANVVPQLHHALGFAYGSNLIVATYTQNPPFNENPDFPQVDTFNRLDVDSGISMSSRVADATARRIAVQAFAASAATLEGSAAGELQDLPDTSSTATRFEWGNAPPGTLISGVPANWDAPSCSSPNAYEDPGCPHVSRAFVQYTPANGGQAGNVVLVENHVPSYYTTDGRANIGDQPVIGQAEAIGWSRAYTTEIAAYTNANYSVVTSQESFLGPGQRGGGNLSWFTSGQAFVAYIHSATQQRGPALIATLYDSDQLTPLSIAHDVVGLSPVGGDFFLTKGGGGGAEPNQASTYSPADAADILQSRFVDKSNALGVNLSNGSIGYTAPANLAVGNGGFPYELTADIEWNPAPQPPAYLGLQSPISPPPGWTTNWHNKLAMSGSALEAMGKTDLRATVGTIAAFLVTQDIFRKTPSQQRDIGANLAQAWWARQIRGNVVTVTHGTHSQQFLGLPEGVTIPGTTNTWFSPGPGTASSLAVTGTRAAYEQRCTPGPNPAAPYANSRGWKYSGMSFAVTNPHGDTENFAYWSNKYSMEGQYECGFAQGFRLETWNFPQQVTVTLHYGNKIDPQKPGSGEGFEQLTSVSNNLSRQIVFTGTNGAVTGFNNGLLTTDPDYRSVSYNQTSATDPANIKTSFILLDPQSASPTARPVPHKQLFQIYTAEKPSAPHLEYDYDTLGHVMQVQDAETLQVGDRFPYTFYIAEGTRGERDDPLGGSWSATYDGYGNPSRYIDERGYETDTATDGRGRVSQYIYPEGDQELFQYDDHNNTTLYTRVPKPSSCTPTCPPNLVVSAAWDQDWNKPHTVTDARGKLTTLNYFPKGDPHASLLQSAVRPHVTGGSPTYTYTYDSYGRLLTATDPVTSATSITTQNTYSTDGFDNLLSTSVDPANLNLTTSFTYDGNGDVKVRTDPRGNAAVFSYDNDRRKLQAEHHNGGPQATLLAVEKSIYDEVGREKEKDVAKCFDSGCTSSGSTVNSWIPTKKTTFTPTWKPATVTDADNEVTTTIYDALDRPSIVTDPMLRQTAFAYDAVGQVLTETRGLGTQDAAIYASYTWGAEGEKLTEMDADGVLAATQYYTSYSYDGFNRLAITLYPDGSSEQIPATGGYDENGNVLAKINRAAQTLSFGYDALNRMTSKSTPAYGSAPSVTTTYGYDLGGRRASYSDTASNSIALTNDTAGRLTQVDTTIPGLSGTRTVAYQLDGNGNRTQLTWPDGYFASYIYDGLDRMTQVKENGTSLRLALYSYDALSRRTGLTFPGGSSVSYSYSDAGDLWTLNHTIGGTGTVPSYTLGYTDAHQLKSESSSVGSYIWQPSAAATAFYGAVNNLNQYPVWTPSGVPKTFGYDLKGNLTSGTTVGAAWSFSYDPENRLVGAAQLGVVSTVNVAYAYDPLGRRTHKSGPGATETYFLDDGDDEIAEYNASGTVTFRYVPGPAINQPIVQITPSPLARAYIQTDHHGSVIGTVAGNGNESQGPFTYDPFGNGAASAGIPYKFVGMRLDPETGLYYDRARYYSPVWGRFLQADPVGYKDDLNLYTYVGNDPTNRTDPTGKATIYDYPDQSIVVQTFENSTQFTDVQISVQGANLSGQDTSGRKVITILTPGHDSDAAYIKGNSKLNDQSSSGSDRSHTDKIGGRNVEIAPNAAGPATVGHELGHVTGAGDQYVGGVDAKGNTVTQAPPNSQNTIMRDLGGPANSQTVHEIVTAPTNTHVSCTSNAFESTCK